MDKEGSVSQLNITPPKKEPGFPGGSEVKVCLPAMQETRVRFLCWEDPTLVFLPGESHRQRSLVGYSPWGHKESDTTEQLLTYLKKN